MHSSNTRKKNLVSCLLDFTLCRHPMQQMSGPTGVQYTGLATSTNAAYEMMKTKREMEDSSNYDLVDQSHPLVQPPSPLSKSGEGEYVIPNLPEISKQAPAVPAMSPAAVAPSQNREGGTQEEIVYEPIPGDQ